MTQLPLLIELGTEELPPGSVAALAHAFCDGVTAGLAKRGIACGAARPLWTPRRLAMTIAEVAMTQPEQMLERRGPALNAGLDAAGNPTRALAGFAASCGVEVVALEKLETDKGSWFVHRAVKTGVPTAALLPEIVNGALAGLPISRPMRWGEREVQFVRPVHWLVMLLGDDVVEGEVLGLASGRHSRGHRFHHAQPVAIARPAEYVEALRRAFVLVDPQERQALIRAQVEAEAAALGATAQIPAGLLEEVTNLCEWPVAIACAFEREFLRVPQEALITTMEANQKFFPVLDARGKLTERFIGVANIQSKDPAEIRKGYERVIRPRFADAAFFFDEDLKVPLEQHQATLKKVTYQQQLGTLWEKCLRVACLAQIVANRFGTDAALTTRAALLSKCDLMTRMVGEFPELQGTMGRYYAEAQGEPAAIARAIEEHYWPRFAGDRIPTFEIGKVLAVADKVDTLSGIFAVGLKPSGSKDPYALRRNALGLARILVEGAMDLDVTALLRDALETIPHPGGELPPNLSDAETEAFIHGEMGAGLPQHRKEALATELYDFVLDRLRGYYADQGIRGDVFDAVAAVRPASLVDFDQRLRAIAAFARLPEAESLAAANKRIGNILRQAREKGERFDTRAAQTAPATPEETALTDAIEALRAEVEAAVARRDYVAAMKRLASLRASVDTFFDKVMVMAEDPAVRRNRLFLLKELRARFVAIADISVLQPA